MKGANTLRGCPFPHSILVTGMVKYFPLLLVYCWMEGGEADGHRIVMVSRVIHKPTEKRPSVQKKLFCSQHMHVPIAHHSTV